MTKRIVTITALLGLIASPAFAHHPLGGDVPQTLMHGLLSGIGHPIIGFDHLAFIIGIGLLAAFQQSRFIIPLGFVAGTVIGTVAILGGLSLPMVEPVITVSVLLIGILVMMGRNLPAIASVSLAGAAGIFHGTAYGQAVVGAEQTPLIAYIAGFGVVQTAIAIGAMLAAQWVMASGQAYNRPHLAPRLIGAMIAGVGLTYLVEIAEAAIFPAL